MGYDEACSVKMAGYWPYSFFLAFMDRDRIEVHKQAKTNFPISSHLDQTSFVNKGLINREKERYFLAGQNR